MTNVLAEDQFRVTSIPYHSDGLVIFSGVPIKPNSYRINSGKYYVTIKSSPRMLPVAPAMGQHWSVKGYRTVEDKEISDYVMQQHTYPDPEFVKCDLPDTGEQLIQFIANEKDFRGIGESKARGLYQLLGEDFHRVMRSGCPKDKNQLRSVLSDDSIDALFEGYAKYKNLSFCNWLSEHQIPSPVQQRLLKFHDDESIHAINDNPYLLIAFGMSFKEIDSIARSKFKICTDDNRRLSAALEFAIKQKVEKGHTFTNQHELRPNLNKLLGDRDLVTQAFKAGYCKAQYVLNPETGSYHPTAQLLMESVVAKRLLALIKRTFELGKQTDAVYYSALTDLPYSLTIKQIEAVKTCLRNSVSCIIGGAGTGKTTVLRTVLQVFHELKYEIHAVALSGRAAMRLHESIGFNTMTVAALLRSPPIEPSTKSQTHLLVIDEASMIDIPTMYRLVNHIHPSVRIIFAGDPDQLPPIGCGKVLSDLVLSELVAKTALNIVKRQKGATGIPEYSKLINQGLVPGNLSTGNIHFHDTSKQNIAEVCCDLYQQFTNASRVIAPTKALVAEINKLIQESVNKEGKRLEFMMHGEHFYQNLRLRDAILFTKNHYEKGLQNGSLGTLTSIEISDQSYGVVTLDTGEKVEVDQAVLDCMELGYAITLHKAQGSQFPRVIVALQRGRIVDRAWLYTAITRAESEVHIVGSEEDFRTITEQPSIAHSRNSYLVELLRSITQEN